jgi:hypothetical protein
MKINTDFIGSTLELSHPAGEMTWKEAMNTTWPDGWRMPTRVELIALFHEAEEDRHIFKSTPDVWTASPYAPDPAYAWDVDFNDGDSFANHKTNTAGVRLVREPLE